MFGWLGNRILGDMGQYEAALNEQRRRMRGMSDQEIAVQQYGTVTTQQDYELALRRLLRPPKPNPKRSWARQWRRIEDRPKRRRPRGQRI